MTSDGIASHDWDRVHELAVDIVNAGANDSDDADTLRASLLNYLAELDAKYGELPSLLATRADYVEDPRESERLLLRAYDLARETGDRRNLRSIAVSLADLYATEVKDPAAASQWLETALPYMDGDESWCRRQRSILDTLSNLPVD